MSKYHPLDVRHPANRDRERNNYLLDPPDASSYELRTVERAAQAPSRRSADYRAGRSPQSDTPPSAPTAIADPWGGSSTPAPAAQPRTATPPTSASPVTQTRRRGGWGRLIVFAIIAFVILRNTALWDQISFLFTRTLYDLGLY
ncbi:MAG: hypothetical protein KDK01_16020 [Rhodobacteraceae bacterium]|jgi:hypothetical protein|nr:hypothetical protein [Paracoccaceae bacterium]